MPVGWFLAGNSGDPGVWGLALLLDLHSKWQILHRVENGMLIGFLIGGTIVLVHETHSHVQKTLLFCDFRSGGAVATADVRCVDHWLQQDPTAADGGGSPCCMSR